MTLKTRLSKLEQTEAKGESLRRNASAFRPMSHRILELRAEMEAVATVTCPIHGKRFKNLRG